MPYRSAFESLHEGGDGRLLLVGDHASNAVPQAYDSLGLPAGSFSRHIAYDLGVHDLVSALSERLNAPAVLAGFSRLLIDPNRGEDDPTLVMRLSDGEIIPGNAAADDTEIARRLTNYHRPYHAAVDAALTRALAGGIAPMLISIHSFTPAWRGRPRPWHCGILWWGDKETADFCLASLRAMKDLVVGDNQPYSGALEGDSMDRHGTKRGICHVLIEIRQDLIGTEAGRREWVERLSPLISQLAARGRRLA
jgi:predicted N-formylglutamate amidohydrolase